MRRPGRDAGESREKGDGLNQEKESGGREEFLEDRIIRAWWLTRQGNMEVKEPETPGGRWGHFLRGHWKGADIFKCLFLSIWKAE